MKKITRNQVMEALQDYASLEQNYDGMPWYYIHLDENFEPVPQSIEAEYTFTAEAGYTSEELAYVDLVDLEVESNPGFMEAVEELTEKINEEIESW